MTSIKPILGIVLIVSLISFSFISIAYAQAGGPPEIEWKKTYGGTNSDDGYTIIPTDDGGYMVSGVTRSYGNGSFDSFLMKLDANGNVLWNKTYGGTGGDWLYGMKKAADGGYLMAGATGSFGAPVYDYYLVKVDADGNIIWDKHWGGSQQDAGFALDIRSNNDILVTGYYTPLGSISGKSDLYTYLLNSSGDLMTHYSAGMAGNDWGKSITVTPDGGFIVGGWSDKAVSGDPDMYAVKFYANGTEAWNRRFGGTGGDYGYSITIAPDGGYILGGHTTSSGAGANDLYVVKMDLNGNKVWEKTYGYAQDETGTQVLIEDDGYLLTGNSESFNNGLSSVYLVKTDFDGNKIWDKAYSDNVSIYGAALVKTADGGYVMTGNMNKYSSGQDDILVIKFKGNAPAPAPAGNVLEKVAPPVAAVVVGTGVGLLGLLFAKILGFINQLLGKPEGAITAEFDKMIGFVDGYIKSHLKGLLFRKESKIRKVTADEKPAVFLGFSWQEIIVSIVASLLLAAAYLFAKKADWLPETILLYLFASGVAIILHDLMHRFLAHKYKAVTEYKFWGLGTIAMFATALLFGVVYAVPARTIVNNSGKMKPEELGIIYGAGPLLSFLIALVFAPLMFMGGWLATLGLIGFSANLVSATYSLMPFDPMDGNKVFKWNKAFWLAPFAVVLVVFIVTTIMMI